MADFKKKQLNLSINGSPNSNGSSAFIINKIIESIDVNNTDYIKYNLGEMKINYCLGCKQCHKTGKCIHNDDVEIVIKNIVKADLLIIASPSYWGDITGQLKVFFDRNTPFSDTNPNNNKIRIPKNKIGISIAIRAGSNEKETIHMMI
jgi:multimeric flavodoxin WrbA